MLPVPSVLAAAGKGWPSVGASCPDSPFSASAVGTLAGGLVQSSGSERKVAFRGEEGKIKI